MDIKFTFVYDTKNNSFFLKKPDKKSKKYHKPILDNFKKKRYDKIETGQRVEVELGKNLKIYMIKKSKYMFGILGPKVQTKIEIFKYLEEVYKKFKVLGKNPKIKRDDPIIIFIKDEMKAFKEGKRKTVTERIDDRLRSATTNLENQLTRAMEMNTQLIQLDEEVQEIKEVAIENKDVANEVKNEAWWYNQKLSIAVFGMTGFFVLMIGLWIVNEIL